MIIATKKNTKGAWPFNVKSVEVHRYKASVYCVIQGQKYSLNGMSTMWLKFPHVTESKYHIIGISVAEVIAMGLNTAETLENPTTQI